MRTPAPKLLLCISDMFKVTTPASLEKDCFCIGGKGECARCGESEGGFLCGDIEGAVGV